MKIYNPTTEEYTQDYFNSLTLLQKISVVLKIVQYQHLKMTNGRFLTYSRLNPFNPLAWILGLGLIIIAVAYSIWENLLTAFEAFKYND